MEVIGKISPLETTRGFKDKMYVPYVILPTKYRDQSILGREFMMKHHVLVDLVPRDRLFQHNRRHKHAFSENKGDPNEWASLHLWKRQVVVLNDPSYLNSTATEGIISWTASYHLGQGIWFLQFYTNGNAKFLSSLILATCAMS